MYLELWKFLLPEQRKEDLYKSLLGIYIENIGVASLLHKYWFTLLTSDTKMLLSPSFSESLLWKV